MAEWGKPGSDCPTVVTSLGFTYHFETFRKTENFQDVNILILDYSKYTIYVIQTEQYIYFGVQWYS